MQTEIEAKFLHIDIDEMRHRLTQTGASLATPERLMRRRVFDFPHGALAKRDAWVRVRDEGDRITMSVKEGSGNDIHSIREALVTVTDFDTATDFLTGLGLQLKAFQENRRESWRLGEVEIDLDTWPWVDPVIEIEGPHASSVQAAAETLGLDWKQAVFGGIEPVYMDEFDVDEHDVYRWEMIRFTPVPAWLEAKRRHQ
jgi:adenylate cyclase class 2